MVIAVIKTGGKQYKVQEKDIITVERLNKKEKETIDFPDILAGKKVRAKVMEHGQGKKIRVFKFRHKTGYSKTHGHRQSHSKLMIEAIK